MFDRTMQKKSVCSGSAAPILRRANNPEEATDGIVTVANEFFGHGRIIGSMLYFIWNEDCYRRQVRVIFPNQPMISINSASN